MEEEWPPPEARVRAALWEGEQRLRRGEYAAAGDALGRALSGGPPASTAVARGLRLLAAAGYRHASGDPERARRLAARARAQLEPYLPAYEDIDLGELAELVEEAMHS